MRKRRYVSNKNGVFSEVLKIEEQETGLENSLIGSLYTSFVRVCEELFQH